jgi:8-oxo-dGTP pyrophosphatase MutT (NUDIX family)
MLASGHLEANETVAQCGIREALKETGLDVALVPGPAALVPEGFPRRAVPVPWLVAEVPACADRHTGQPHVHPDHVYVATAAGVRPVGEPEHQVRWFTPADIASGPGISEDSRILAAELIALISDHPGGAFAYYLDVPFAETVRRHTAKTGTFKYGGAEMRRWYRSQDLLPMSGVCRWIPALWRAHFTDGHGRRGWMLTAWSAYG